MKNRLPKELNVSDSYAGTRLDAMLSTIFQELGVRGRRRLWEWCNITVNNRPCPKGYIVNSGDFIRISEKKKKEFSFEHQLPLDAPSLSDDLLIKKIALIKMNTRFAAIEKPSGIHSAHISGGNNQSIESVLPMLWERIKASKQSALPSNYDNSFLPRLLTRLDVGTSGIILLALSRDATHDFRHWEAQKLTQKHYFALVHGKIEQPLVISNAIDTADRKKSLVLPYSHEDPIRCTMVNPLFTFDKLTFPTASQVKKVGCSVIENYLQQNFIKFQNFFSVSTDKCLHWEPNYYSFVCATIFRGARHQIRAHLANAGYPLVGDLVYGSSCEERGYFLHHVAVKMPGFEAVCFPDWEQLEPERLLGSL